MQSSVREELQKRQDTWLVTGAAGFIGSHLVEYLLKHNQKVVALDNLSTGKKRNLELIEAAVGADAWARCRVVIGDVSDPAVMKGACTGVQHILHQAALGSVPRSIEDPWSTHEANVSGFLQVLIAAREAGVKRVVYASSSSVYGDHPELPKREEQIGSVLSPYAASKRIDEIYAQAFARSYDMQFVGLRYFNVFGPRQDPNGVYAAVIPRWVDSLRSGRDVTIYGDGETSRDFCFVGNVVDANLRAALSQNISVSDAVFNVACGGETSLNELISELQMLVEKITGHTSKSVVTREGFRAGDIKHSRANISKAEQELGYKVLFSFEDGLRQTVERFLANRD